MKLSAMILVAFLGLLSVQLVTACGGNSLPRLLTQDPVSIIPNKSLKIGEWYESLFLNKAKLGAWRGIKECERLFDSSWRLNCSFVRNFVDPNLPIFVNATLPYATPETALIHAISSAAITYEVTHWCLVNISGGKSVGTKNKTICLLGNEKYPKWGYNFEFGQNETKRLIDDLETGNGARTAMNLHNNKVGREAVAVNHILRCKLERQSTSSPCNPPFEAPFEAIGVELKKKYHNAVRVWFFNNRLHEKAGNQFKAISSEDTRLVYLEHSPDFCVKNDSVGVPGMLGMTCQSTDDKDTNCESLVAHCSSCQLKHQTKKRVKLIDCYCKFYWCCHVRCKKCPKKYFETTCFRNPLTHVH